MRLKIIHPKATPASLCVDGVATMYIRVNEKNIYHELCAKKFVTLTARSEKNFGCAQREKFWQN